MDKGVDRVRVDTQFDSIWVETGRIENFTADNIHVGIHNSKQF